MRKNFTKIAIATMTIAGLLPAFVLAFSFDFSRAPAGAEFSGNLNVDIVDFTGLPEYDNPLFNEWRVEFYQYEVGEPVVYSDWLAYNPLGNSFNGNFNLPVGDYSAIVFAFGIDGESQGGDYFEGNETYIIFSVVAPEGILTIPDGALASVMAYSGRLWEDLWEILSLFIGLPIAFWILNKIISLPYFRKTNL